ncbi:MAG: DUF1566 domain-containing protein [Bacteroidales bacterium]|nr:DUF1566 domain-containing protein [Bacteroidales bacterium]
MKYPILLISCALLLATSCSKNNDDPKPSPIDTTAVDPNKTVVVPISLTVANGADIFQPSDNGVTILQIEDENIKSSDLVLANNSNTYKFEGNVEILESKAQDFHDGKIKLIGTFATNQSNPIYQSNTSLNHLKANCSHTYTATFASNANYISPIDQTVYLAFKVSNGQKKFVLNCNGKDYEFSTFSPDGEIWIAMPCNHDGKAQIIGAMISNSGIILDAGTLYEADRTDVVDMGSPFKILWRIRNLGAETPTDYGKYYAWGQITGYEQNEPHPFGPSNYSNTTDINDPATEELGNGWRMPTYDELRELAKYKADYDKGYTFENEFGSVYLPVAGFRDETGVHDYEDYGYCWTSTLVQDRPGIAWSLYFFEGSAYMHHDKRYYAQSVRPVWEIE